jgi:hypothetical protein
MVLENLYQILRTVFEAVDVTSPKRQPVFWLVLRDYLAEAFHYCSQPGRCWYATNRQLISNQSGIYREAAADRLRQQDAGDLLEKSANTTAGTNDMR